MRAFITGACGFVGTYLVRHLLDSGDEVFGTVFSKEPHEMPCQAARMDICDFQACSDLIGAFRPQAIYHLAGLAFVPEAENNFDTTLRINVGGTNNIFRVCHLLRLGCPVVLISSAEVYGSIKPEDLPVNESLPLAPGNNYSLSKAMAEMVAERYGRQGFVKSVIMRPFNHIGPGQDNRFVASSFAYQLAMIAKKKSPPVIRVGNLEARRDFSDVRDIVRAYRLAAMKGSGTYNLSSGRSIRIYELLETLISISGQRVDIETDAARMRPSDIPETYGSNSKAERELGWRPERELRATLSEIYSYWLEHA